ncbi:MAG TPA: MoxR family ATPase [Clostridia bacterium]|jgi:MoxR-like ATPase|nr:MoxR family ATPase [Clostridia bacterium]
MQNSAVLPFGPNSDQSKIIDEIKEGMKENGYLCSDTIANVLYLAEKLQKPVLVEGPAGVGKTELAKALSGMKKAELIRLQCYEGLDEAKALYEWNYKKQLLHIQAMQGKDLDWEKIEENIFDEDFLLSRPLLKAITSDKPTVLLIDEIDKVDLEFEALLLEILSDFQISIPELGTIKAKNPPFVILTSNNTRELTEALKRRCLFLFLDYPDMDRELEIVKLKVPELPEHLAKQIVRVVRLIRSMDIKKSPSISETLDWARAIFYLGVDSLDRQTVETTLNVLLKYQGDMERVTQSLRSGLRV